MRVYLGNRKYDLGAYCSNIDKKIVDIASFFRIITSLLYLL